ncbi:MAG: sodium:solute symporter family protein, partial [Oscillospiraceae bacterium]
MKGIIVSVILVYMLFLFVVAYLSNRKIKNNEDYLVAGRTLGPIIVACTISATEIGGGSSLSIIEKSYGEWGFSAIWYILAMSVAFACIAIIAPKIRLVRVKTIPEFFRRRYNEDTALLTSIIMIFPLVGLAASQLIVAGSVLSTFIGINYHVA